MKIVILFFFTVFLNLGIYAQTNIHCNQKMFCKILSEDQEECNSTVQNNSFEINKKETIITQSSGSRKTEYLIKEKIYDKNTGVLTYHIHSLTGEKLNFTIDPKSVKIHSVSYPYLYLVHYIKK